MPSSEPSSYCESDDENLLDLQKLQPNGFEPNVSSSNLSSTSSDKDISSSDSETAEESRLGNTNWYPILTYTEILCCLDTNEDPDEYFEGTHNTITQY